jgi:hypothetical protein
VADPVAPAVPVAPQAQAAPVVLRVQVVPVQVVQVQVVQVQVARAQVARAQVVPVRALGPGLGRRRAPEVRGRLLRRRCRGRTPV